MGARPRHVLFARVETKKGRRARRGLRDRVGERAGGPAISRPVPTLPAQSQKWPADRALLFVHGIGNPKAGDYDPLVAEVRAILGDAAARYAFYFLYYDQINE